MCPTHGYLNETMPPGHAGPARSGRTAILTWAEWAPGQLPQGHPGSRQVMAAKVRAGAGRYGKTRDLRLIGWGAEERVRVACDEVRHLIHGSAVSA